MISPSWHPYPYRLRAQPGTVYEFNDQKGRLYFITFTVFDFVEQALLRDCGVVLSLELEDPAARDDGQDPRLEATMVAVVEQVLWQKSAAIIVWVCSANKQQQRARNKLFNRWYQHYMTNGLLAILKKDIEPTPGEYISLLYRADHPDRKELEELPLDLDKL